MRKWELSATGLIAAVIIGTLGFTLGPLRFGWTPTIVSGIVLLVMVVFDRAASRTVWESIGYGAVGGFLVITAIMYPLYLVLPQMTASPAELLSSKPWLPLAWAVGTIAFVTIDRVRANTRPITVSLAPAPAPTAASTVQEQPKPVAPAKPAVPAPEPVPVPRPAVVPPPAVPVSSPVAAPTVTPVETVPAPPTPRPAPTPKPQPVKGRPATIYLNLVGTGISCLRAVKAEHLGQDFYRIVEPVPTGESWEFQPGQIVRCRKRTLSSGKAMVAFEEAPKVTEVS